ARDANRSSPTRTARRRSSTRHSPAIRATGQAHGASARRAARTRPATNGRYARADPTRVVWDARSQQRRSFLDRHTRQRLRMEVGFHTLAPVIHGVHFVAAAVDLDPAHLPAQLAELFLQFLLRLPRVLRARVASREASRRNRRRGEQREAHGGTNRRSNKRDFHTELLCERASRIVPGS